MNTQAKVATEKRAHPERFCPEPRCLWRTNGSRCPRHAAKVIEDMITAALEDMITAAPQYCPRCRSRCYPIDAAYLARTGVCSACATWGKR